LEAGEHMLRGCTAAAACSLAAAQSSSQGAATVEEAAVQVLMAALQSSDVGAGLRAGAVQGQQTECMTFGLYVVSKVWLYRDTTHA